MKKMNLYLQGLINAVLAGVYVLFAAVFMAYVPKTFGPEEGGIFGFFLFLMFFVLSASVMGTLVLGKPVMLYVDGQKKDSVKLFGITLGWIFIIMIITLLLKIAI